MVKFCQSGHTEGYTQSDAVQAQGEHNCLLDDNDVWLTCLTTKALSKFKKKFCFGAFSIIYFNFNASSRIKVTNLNQKYALILKYMLAGDTKQCVIKDLRSVLIIASEQASNKK